MAEFKLVIGTAQGKCVQKEVKDNDATVFLGKKIGETVFGEALNMQGYEFLITGGSDNCGFPMRKDLDGTQRRKILLVAGSGIGSRAKKKSSGCRVKKSVAGNTIFEKTAQINLKILKGDEQQLLGPAPQKEEGAASSESSGAEE